MTKEKFINLINESEMQEFSDKIYIDAKSGKVIDFTGIKIESTQFELEGIKMDPKTKMCVVDYICDSSNATTSMLFKGSITPPYQCNSVLQGLLDKLKPYLCDVREIKTDKRDNVIAIGVKLYGNGDTASWNILGKQKPFKDSKKFNDLNTNKVNYQGGVYLWESEVIEVIEAIKIAAFEYAFNNASATRTLFDNDDEGDETNNSTEVDENEE